MNVKKYDRLILDERVSFNVELIDADGGSCDSDGVVPLRVFVIPPAKSRRRRIRKGGSEKVSVQKSETGQDAGYPNSQIGTRHLFFGVLMDIGMPRMNGYEAVRHIRGQPWGGAMLLVALTGWGQDEDRQRTRDAGFDHHLVKPADPSTLKSLLQAAPT